MNYRAMNRVWESIIAFIVFFGIDRLGASKTAMISTLEPVGTSVLSAIILGQRLSFWQIFGGSIVLFGVLWLQTDSDA